MKNKDDILLESLYLDICISESLGGKLRAAALAIMGLLGGAGGAKADWYDDTIGNKDASQGAYNSAIESNKDVTLDRNKLMKGMNDSFVKNDHKIYDRQSDLYGIKGVSSQLRDIGFKSAITDRKQQKPETFQSPSTKITPKELVDQAQSIKKKYNLTDQEILEILSEIYAVHPEYKKYLDAAFNVQ